MKWIELRKGQVTPWSVNDLPGLITLSLLTRKRRARLLTMESLHQKGIQCQTASEMFHCGNQPSPPKVLKINDWSKDLFMTYTTYALWSSRNEFAYFVSRLNGYQPWKVCFVHQLSFLAELTRNLFSVLFLKIIARFHSTSTSHAIHKCPKSD
jgi:hypothetical protein